MLNFSKIKALLLLTIIAMASGCVEEFDFQAETFESALVVEATLTNENKPQTVLLSRTFAIDEDGPVVETNATVRVQDSQGTQYFFEELTPGEYVSTTAFAATAGNAYQLFITLANGRNYTSTSQPTPQETQINNLTVQRGANLDGIDGVSVFVDSFDPTGNAQFFRYKYEETYKIIAPEWKDTSLVVVDPAAMDCEVQFVERPVDVRTCFATDTSININQTSLGNTDRVEQHLVRFINSNNPIISHRYSIKVRQFVQNSEAYTYFKTLSDFANEGNLFSQIQAGFIKGNIISETNPEEKTIGFFEVSTVDEERIFFNYQDLFPGESLPPYFVNCTPFAPLQFTMSGSCGELITRLNSDEIIYIDLNTGQVPTGGPYLMALKICGDCTDLGPTDPPDFWIE